MNQKEERIRAIRESIEYYTDKKNHCETNICVEWYNHRVVELNNQLNKMIEK